MLVSMELERDRFIPISQLTSVEIYNLWAKEEDGNLQSIKNHGSNKS